MIFGWPDRPEDGMLMVGRVGSTERNRTSNHDPDGDLSLGDRAPFADPPGSAAG
jgi:hypothetical protein